MKFALLGEHSDGLAMARALTATGRHELLAYCGPATGAELLRRWQIGAKLIGDMEEVLADPLIEAVIVAGPLKVRPEQLRRALQSERHVLCVHPADDTPDIAYEAAMIQADTGKLLFPLLPDSLHPAIRRLTTLIQVAGTANWFFEIERGTTEGLLLETDRKRRPVGIPGWDILRLVGGEIIELMAFAAGEELPAAGQLLLSGRFEHGGLFQATHSSGHSDDRWRCAVSLDGKVAAELMFPRGMPGPARLSWQDETGTQREDSWESIDPWAAVVTELENVVAGKRGQGPIWQDEIRALELDDAARRSVERRRASTLEFQEVSEEVGFKGTMTLIGCGLLWFCLGLLIASVWVPWAGWLILPVIGVFLLLQVLLRVVPPKPSEAAARTQEMASPRETQKPGA